MSEPDSRVVQRDPEVISGDDAMPRQPPDRTTLLPEPGGRRGQHWNAIRLAWIPFLAFVAAIIIYGFLR